MLSSESSSPAPGARSGTVIHPSYPFLLVVLWIESDHWIRLWKLLATLNVLIPGGWSIPPNIQQEGKRNKEERNLSSCLSVSSPRSGNLQMYHFAGKTPEPQVPLSFARAINPVDQAHSHQRLANKTPRLYLCRRKGRLFSGMCLWEWVCAYVLSRARLFTTPWAVACQAPLSMEFSRQEYCSGLPFPTPGDLPIPGIELASPGASALAGRFFTTEATSLMLFSRYFLFLMLKTMHSHQLCYLLLRDWKHLLVF